MAERRWTWRRIAEDNQAQLNTALELLQAAEIERDELRARLQRTADAPCSHCSATWLHGERNTAHFIAGQARHG